MKILVVGGAGYVGGAVTDILDTAFYVDHEFVVYDALLYEDSYRKNVNFVRGDIRDTDRLHTQLKWADAVIWLAALVGDGACEIYQDASWEINAEAVRFLVQHFQGRIVFASTCSVYGQHGELVDETAQISPASLYGDTKLAAEGILKCHPNAIVFRLGTLFGVSDRFSRIRLDLVVNYMTLKAALYNTIEVRGGQQWRPLLHVRDAAAMLVDSAFRPQRGVYNLVRQNVQILDLAHQIRCHFPNARLELKDPPQKDPRNYCVSGQKALDELYFRPARTIDEGIDEIAELLKTGRLKDPGDQRHNNELYLKKDLAWTRRHSLPVSDSSTTEASS